MISSGKIHFHTPIRPIVICRSPYLHDRLVSSKHPGVDHVDVTEVAHLLVRREAEHVTAGTRKSQLSVEAN